jgi:uncharacterized protein YecA (UPF0149 family)
MEDVKYAHIDDAEVISEGVDTEATVEDLEAKENNERLQQHIREWQEMYAKMHTPFKREYRKVGRNEICPFCDSGLKFKHCECSQTYGEQVSY